MNITLHIDRIVLHGTALGAGGRALLQAAIEAELARLLVTGGLSESLAAGATLAKLPGVALPAMPESSPAALGAGIAQAVYGGIGPGDAGRTEQ